MAGIGFNLQRILEKDTYFSSFRAHFYSVLISAGPWILSILTIFTLNHFAPSKMDIFELTYFRALLIYIYAFSLIFVGILHYPLTRYLADKLYNQEKLAMVPTFNIVSLLVIGCQLIGGSLFFFSGQKMIVCFYGVLIYITISLIWMIMIFLTALKDYHAIVIAFFLGTLVTIGACLYGGTHYGLVGYLFGYFIGHFVIVVLWSARIFTEFSSERIFEWEFLPFFLKKKALIFTGFFFNLALWVDKIIFWISPHAVSIEKNLRVFPDYESAVFVAYLTIIPVLSLFMIRVETDFYRHYRGYYMGIVEKATYPQLITLKEKMMQSLRESAGLLIRYQGILTIVAILFAPQIVDKMHLQWAQIPLFRICVLGSFVHSLLLVTVLIILYYDFQDLALWISAVYLVTNTLFTWITTKLTFPYFGYGYFFAALVSLAFAYYALSFKLGRLHFYTFSSQPMAVHRSKEIV